MNTKSFAQQARKILMRGVKDKLRYWGFDAKGNAQEEPAAVPGGYEFRGEVFDDPAVPPIWQSLRRAIKHKGYDTVVEEAAYTWFNRIMAIRILSKNGYEPPTLDFADGVGRTPEILQLAKRGTAPFLNETEKKRLQRIITDGNRDTESFAILLIGYCHSHTLLQTVFGSIDDYTELLLPDDILAQYSEKAHIGLLDLLNITDAISDEEYRKVELIGWLYQFYISEKKDEVFAGFKKNKKAEAEDIPAATQIFTPNWIVKYMVQNTVGKIWLDLHPDSPLKANMKYLVEDAPQDASSTTPHSSFITPHSSLIKEVQQLKLLDPAVGSGHILVEGFDLLYDMYIAEYYPPGEAVESILRHNLYGLDIDKRAAQLAQFAVLLKAAGRYPDILKKGIRPNIHAMPESHEFSRQDVLDFLGKDGLAYADHLFSALHLMQQAQNLGSIMQFDLPEAAVAYISQRWTAMQQADHLGFHEKVLMPALSAYLPVLLMLCHKYEAVVANPPYMGQGNMNGALKDYVNAHYPLSKSDLFAVFMEVCLALNTKDGLMGMINQHSWMFLSSYEKLREHLLQNYSICNMLHLGPRVFEELSGEVVQSTAFVLSNTNSGFGGTYYRLVDYKESGDKERRFAARNHEFRNIDQTNFYKIPGAPIAYWVSDSLLSAFRNNVPLSKVLNIKVGLQTGENERFLRLWFEVSMKLFDKTVKYGNPKWYPYNKGGGYKKWYGNQFYIVNWENKGYEIRNHKGSMIRNESYYFEEGITWSDISTGSFACRYTPEGFLFDVKGSSGFSRENLFLKIGFLNCKVSTSTLYILNPTMSYQVGNIQSLPFDMHIINWIKPIDQLVNDSIDISKKNYDSQETSWDFKQSYILNGQSNIQKTYEIWGVDVTNDFFQLHANEEELNRIFIDIYGLQDELTPEVPLRDITILQEELNSKDLEALEQDFRSKGRDGITLPIRRDVVMQQFLSYLIGVCMGRYRLDKPGLQIAHPNPTDEETANYAWNGQEVEIDDDAILPLMGSASEFPDEAVLRIKQLLDVIWGEHTRTENINFLQECLDMDLEKYMVKNFWKDHCKRYKKKPIYWLFASPGGAFQVLVYMHRMNAFTVERIREKYLLPHIKQLRGKISMMEARSAQLSSQEARQLDHLRNDLLECEQYEMVVKGVADAQIVFDLDDGVTVNYARFSSVVAPIK